MSSQPSAPLQIDAELQHVRECMLDCLAGTYRCEFADLFGAMVGGGKMLRSRLTLCLGVVSGVRRSQLVRAGAVVEMLHATSLLHDDMLDGGTRRRETPARWVSEGARVAVLLGDLLVSLAAEEVQKSLPQHLHLMIVTLREMCDAAAEQGFAAADAPWSWEQGVSIARRKTGSLFGFAAACAGGSQPARVEALRRAGYALGTAYHLATVFPAGGTDPTAAITSLLRESEDELASWPELQQAWREYVRAVVAPRLA